MSLYKLNKSTSPWQDPSLENLFRTELSLASSPINFPMFKSLPALKWVNSNNASELLFKGLAKLAPLYPIIAYRGVISAYVSPPTSGAGNTALLIMGKDQSGKVRLVGSNLSCWPTGQSGGIKTNFFEKFDRLSNWRDQETLIIETISSHMTFNDLQIAKEVAYQSELFKTMPIKLLVLDGNKSHMAFSPAVVYGNYPCDMSLEFLGEVL
jgi:hypothetical protein